MVIHFLNVRQLELQTYNFKNIIIGSYAILHTFIFIHWPRV